MLHLNVKSCMNKTDECTVNVNTEITLVNPQNNGPCSGLNYNLSVRGRTMILVSNEHLKCPVLHSTQINEFLRTDC